MPLVIQYLLIFTLLLGCNVEEKDGSILSGPGAPVYQFTVTNPALKTYGLGENLRFKLTFPKAVVVTGSPRLQLDLGGSARTAQYVSGNGSRELIFNYVIIAGDNAPAGVVVDPNLDLNGGQITYTLGTTSPQASTNLLLTSSPEVKVDTTAPVATVGPPPNSLYLKDNLIHLSLLINEPVVVSGSPRLQLTVGSDTKYATFVSGSGTSTLIFRYVVAKGDLDLDGIVMNSTLDVNGGSIKDLAGNSLPTTLTAPNLSSVHVNGVNPFVTNAFVPAAGTYTVGQNLDYRFRFSEIVTVTGAPSIQLNIGGTTRLANYHSGSGTDMLTFRYPVAGTDEDTDGVTHTQLLTMGPGNEIKDSLGNTALPNFVSPLTPGVIVVPGAPSITGVAWNAGTYLANQTTDVTLTFSKNVTVTGTPRLSLAVGGTTRFAQYLSGSGTSALVFRHGIVTGDEDADGVVITPPVELNGGTIKDAQGVAASLTFTTPSSADLLVEASVPTITSVSVPTDGNYTTGQNLDFTLNFSESVNVVNPAFVKLKLQIGAQEREASYVSGSGTAALLFRYAVVNQDLDEDGLQLKSPLSVTGTGAVRDLAGNGATLVFTPPFTAGLKVNYQLTNILSMTAPNSKTYAAGESMDFTANFSHLVNVIGSPRISITVGSITRYADYLSGTGTSNIVFRHVVVASDQDANGITMASPIQLNGGTIKNSLGNDAVLSYTPPNTSGVVIDGGVPSISFITPPAGGTYIAGQNWVFTVALSEVGVVSGNPRIALNVGGVTRYATYQSGSGSTDLTFLYTTLAGDNDANGIDLTSPLSLNGGTLKNTSGFNFALTFTPPTTTALRIDTTAPLISSVTAPASQTYGAGANIDFLVTFNEPVTVNGTPRISLDVGGVAKYAQYLSGSGSPNLIFRYQVQVGDSDPNGVTLSTPVELNGGAIEDVPGNPAVLSFTSPDTSGVIIGAIPPTITNVSVPSNGNYPAGTNLEFVVTFDTEVVVTGLPRLPITIGAVARNAALISGSGTNSLTFRYTVVAPDTDSDGISLASAVQLNGGTIKDVYDNVATLGFTPPDTSLVIVDTTAPGIFSILPPANGTYLLNQNLDFTVNFTEQVLVTGSPRLGLTIGASAATAVYVSGSGTSALLFRFTVTDSSVDADGIQMDPALNLNGGTVKDLATNALTNLTLSPPDLSLVRVDGVLPIITDVTSPAAGVYKDGDALTFTVTFNKFVTASGGPRVPLTLGGAAAYATLTGGTSGLVLTFTYNVGTSDLDLDGVALSAGGIDLNGGSIIDNSSQNAALTFSPVPDLSEVYVVLPSFRHWFDLDDTARVSTTFDGIGDAVNSVQDLMGNSDLTASGGTRPYYQAAGFGSGNRGYLQFTGSSVLNFSNPPSFSSAVIVFKSHSDNGVTNSLLSMTSGLLADRVFIELDSLGNLNLNKSADYKLDTGNFTLSPSTSHVWSWLPSTNYLLMLQWSASSSQSTVLGSAPFDGQIAAVILLDDAATPLSEAQFNAIRDFLNAKYGVY